MAGKRAVMPSYELSSRPADGPVREGLGAPGRQIRKETVKLVSTGQTGLLQSPGQIIV